MRSSFRVSIGGLALFVAACGGDGPAAPTTSPVGQYALLSANGHALPASFVGNPLGFPYWIGGTLVINASGTYTLVLTDSLSTGGKSTVNEAGTWAKLPNDSIHFESQTQNLPPVNGSFAGGLITRKLTADLFVWQRK